MTRCPWTGQPFEPVTRGAHQKRFATAAAKDEAHNAARLYALWLIEQGCLSWPALRRWWDRRGRDAGPSYTTGKPADAAQMTLPLGEG